VSEIPNTLQIRHLGLCDYSSVLDKMLDFSTRRSEQTVDEIWLLQHKPVYTLGKNAKQHHVLNSGDIPVIAVDRGGQVTYHGPGQLIAYLLLDVKRKKLGVRQIVTAMENAVINTLAGLYIEAVARPNAPGVYVNDEKIAALGLRIKNGKSYHGLSLNIDMDLSPFLGINPCGYEGMQVTQVKNLINDYSIEEIKKNIVTSLSNELAYDQIIDSGNG